MRSLRRLDCSTNLPPVTKLMGDREIRNRSQFDSRKSVHGGQGFLTLSERCPECEQLSHRWQAALVERGWREVDVVAD
jgi:hypothetical protein